MAKTINNNKRIKKYFKNNKSCLVLYYVNENLIFTLKEKAEKQDKPFKTLRRNGKDNK